MLFLLPVFLLSSSCLWVIFLFCIQRVVDEGVGSLGELSFNVLDVQVSNEMVGSFRLLYTATGWMELKVSYQAVSPLTTGHHRMNVPNTLEFSFEPEAGLATPAPGYSSRASTPGGMASPTGTRRSPSSAARPAINTSTILQHAAAAANDPIVDGLFWGASTLYQRFFGRRGHMVSARSMSEADDDLPDDTTDTPPPETNN